MLPMIIGICTAFVVISRKLLQYVVAECDDLTVKPASELLVPSKNYGDISRIFQSFPTLVKLLFRLLVF